MAIPEMTRSKSVPPGSGGGRIYCSPRTKTETTNTDVLPPRHAGPTPGQRLGAACQTRSCSGYWLGSLPRQQCCGRMCIFRLAHTIPRHQKCLQSSSCRAWPSSPLSWLYFAHCVQNCCALLLLNLPDVESDSTVVVLLSLSLFSNITVWPFFLVFPTVPWVWKGGVSVSITKTY